MPENDTTPGPDQSAAPEDSTNAEDLPADVAEEAARLTRLAIEADDRETVPGPYQSTRNSEAEEAVDGAETDEATLYRERRDLLLSRFGYVARTREEREGGVTLVCYPDVWLDDEGTVRLDSDLDLSRAVEVPLSGPGEQGDFEEAAAANDELVEDVRDAHGDLHAANVRAFADFMSNHYARPATTASAAELREFLDHYYPRNAWPSDEQAALVEESLRYAFAIRDDTYPLD